VSRRDAELLDHLAVLWRSKWLILLGTLSCLLGAAIVTWFLPATYQVRAILDTGELGEDRLKDVERLVARVSAGGYAGGRSDATGRSPVLVSVQFRRPSVIELTVQAGVPGEAVATQRAIAGRLVADLSQLVETEGRRYEMWRRQSRELQQLMERLGTARADAARRATDPAGVLVFVRLADQMVVAESRLADLEQKLQAAPAVPRAARLVAEFPPVRVKPRPRVNLLIGLLVGLFASVVLAFLVEYVRQASIRLRHDGVSSKA
jgi:uncharacterized protein involved in exopolysaccharide biosynthesis